MGFEITLNDNSGEILAALDDYLAAKGEEVGLAMEAHVNEGAPVGTPESTSIKNYHGGAMRKSITHKVIDKTVYVGTNMKAPNGAPYPIYVELGTGIYAANGDGRKSPWVWRDKNGKFHYTRGMKPTHFMRNALSSPEHLKEYKEIYENKR